jgi:hypothetical protein
MSCQKEEQFTTNTEDKLEFSVDTLRFDTVFTQLGSATRTLKVYNRHNESIKISRIFVAGNLKSRFNFNIDGIAGNEVKDVVIYPNDSIYIFGEVTIDPNQPLSISPFFVYDSLMFETNGNLQSVTLEAFGQNANYIPSRFHKDSVVLYTCRNGEVIWNDPKPYVIYGIVAFDECTITLPEGTRLHIHGGVSKTKDSEGKTLIYNSGRLFFGPRGRLQINGTKDRPVIIQGDRLEKDFNDEAGQWTGIILSKGSKGNTFRHAIIKNSLFGVYVDSSAQLSMKNVQIYNTSGVGLFAIHASVTAENCLLYNNGSHSVQLAYGGSYQFNYCTLANYGTNAAALSMGNGICVDQLCQAPPRINALNASFTNSIIYGSKRDEILMTDFTSGKDPKALNYDLKNCIVRVNELLDPVKGFPKFFERCDPCINPTGQEKLFANPGKHDYQLDSLSIAKKKAVPIAGITIDLIGTLRDAQKPDIGCYEYKPK